MACGHHVDLSSSLPFTTEEGKVRFVTIFKTNVLKNLKIISRCDLPLGVQARIDLYPTSNRVGGRLEHALNAGNTVECSDVSLRLVTNEHALPQGFHLIHGLPLSSAAKAPAGTLPAVTGPRVKPTGTGNSSPRPGGPGSRLWWPWCGEPWEAQATQGWLWGLCQLQRSLGSLPVSQGEDGKCVGGSEAVGGARSVRRRVTTGHESLWSGRGSIVSRRAPSACVASH